MPLHPDQPSPRRPFDRLPPASPAPRRTVRLARLAPVLLLGAVLLLPGTTRGAEPAVVTVHADAVEGKIAPESFTNLSTDAVYGQTTSINTDGALGWVRATHALSYVRCCNWLGDGIPKSNPEWFSGCRVAKLDASGQAVYQWEGLERVIDTLLASGVKPYLVCGGMPDALADGPPRRNESGAAVNRPKDYARYGQMLTQMFRRLEKTYGAAEVRSWYFEAWSQPDHDGSWEGGRPSSAWGAALPESAVEPFNRLYDQFAASAAAVDSRLRIGGPGLAGDAQFLRRFLEHCARGTNSVTGRPGTRLDFVSWSGYGTVPEILRRNAELRTLVEADFPELKGLRYVLCESGGSSIEAGRANGAYEAARLAALFDGNARAERGMDLIFRSGDLVDDHFGGFRSLVSRVGAESPRTVPLPALRLNMLLKKMGGERLRAEAPTGIGALASRPAGKGPRSASQVLLYRYEPGVAAGAGSPVKLKVRFTGLPANLLRLPFRAYVVEGPVLSPYEAWQAMGKPNPAPDKLAESLAGTAVFAPTTEENGVAINSGSAVVEVSLPVITAALISLGAEPVEEEPSGDRVKRLRKAEEAFGQAAELQQTRSFRQAADQFRLVADRYPDTFWRQDAIHSLAALYEIDLRNPEEAEAARRELLTLPSLDDFTRLRLLERLRVDVVRTGDAAALGRISTEISDLRARLDAQRQWPLRRYYGN